MSIQLRRAISTALRVALAAGTVASAPQAVGAETEAAKLEPVTVSATRAAVETNLQDTPVAVSAIDSVTINQASPRNIGEIASFVPNFSASTITGFNAASFAMRGVGQNDNHRLL